MNNGAEFLKTLFVDYLGPTILYGGGVWVILAAVFKGWKEWKHSDPPNWAKVLISIVLPYVIVLAVYGAGIFLEAWQYDKHDFINIVGIVTQGVVGSKGWFGATEAVRAQVDKPAAKRRRPSTPPPTPPTP